MKAKIIDAYFSEDNSMMFIEAKCEDKSAKLDFLIDDNMRKIVDFIGANNLASEFLKTMTEQFRHCLSEDVEIEYSEEDFEKIADLIRTA